MYKTIASLLVCLSILFTNVFANKPVLVNNDDSLNSYTITLKFKDNNNIEIQNSEQTGLIKKASLYGKDKENKISGFYTSYWNKLSHEKSFAFKQSSSKRFSGWLPASCRKIVMFLTSLNGKYTMQTFVISDKEMERIFIGDETFLITIDENGNASYAI